MSSAREKLAGLHCQSQHSGTRDRNHHLPHSAHSAEAGLQQRCCLSVTNPSVINLGEICSAAVSEPGSDKLHLQLCGEVNGWN